MEKSIHPLATQHLPSFITVPGETDVLMVVMGVILAIAVLAFGILFLRLHSLPERMAHKSQKVQFEIVAVLCLIALFTHMHIFWIAALLLAFIELPDFGVSLGRIARSTEKLAGLKPGEVSAESRSETITSVAEQTVAETDRTDAHPALDNEGGPSIGTPPSSKDSKKRKLSHA